jgi:F0F1-type ATP synthase assembly protein I
VQLRDNGAGRIKEGELREAYRGFNDGLTLAFEIAFVPTILGFMGYGLDRWLGTLPIFTILLAILGVVGLSTRLWYDYGARMKAHEAEGPWARAAQPERETLARAAQPERETPARAAAAEPVGVEERT